MSIHDNICFATARLLTFGLIVLGVFGASTTFAQPANDNCATAQPVIIPASGTICINSSSVSATSSLTTNNCNAVTVNEVWFTFIAAGPANTITVTPTGGSPIQQPVVTISDAACGSATYNTCDAAANAGGTATANWAYAAGTQVNVSVAGILGDGTFEICITSETPPPTPGSSCGGATPTCDPSDFTLATSAGNLSSGISPACFNIAGIPQLVQNDMWFVFSVGTTGTLQFTAALNGIAEFDWAVYNITNGCPGTAVSCNYWFSGGNSGTIGMQTPAGGEFSAPITVIAGNTYAIMIDNYDNNGVGFDFSWGGTFQMAPTANFTIANPTDCNSLTTTFNNTSVGASTYSWNFGNGSTSVAQNPPAQTYNAPGTYFVTLDATSGAGCTNSFSGSVEVFPDPTVNLSATDETCIGACDGQLVANASGNGPFTYSWNGLPGNMNTQSGLCANSYDVTVTDQSTGCSGTGTGTVQSGGATANATITPVGPFCPADPVVTLSAVDAGGTWSGTGITNAAAGTFDPAVAGIGTWTITYTIAGPCGDTQTTDIVVNGQLDATIDAAGPFCLGDNAATLTSATAGGTWSGTGITNGANGTFDPSVAGIGTWTITYDIPGACGNSDTETIVVGPNADATIDPAGPFCASEAPVNLTAATAGGTWTGNGITDGALGTFDPSVAGLGTHTITYTIAGACGDVQTVDIDVDEITFSQTVIDALCFGGSSGEILIQNPSGTAPHQFSIDGGNNQQAGAQFQNLPAGNYDLQVEDANGCASAVVQVTINEPSEIFPSAFMDQQANCGNADGVATASGVGGTVATDYQYSWNTTPVQNTSTVSNLSPGLHTVTLTDDNGCTASTDVNITSTAGFSISVLSTIDVSCNGVCDGEGTVEPDNLAIAPVGYSWNDPNNQSSATATALCAGVYTVTATDAAGCVATTDVTITEPVPFETSVTPSASTVCIGETTTLTTTLNGGAAPITDFLWTSNPADPTLVPTDQSPTVAPIVQTTYSLVATDANGCTAPQVDVTINVSSPLDLQIIMPAAVDTGVCLGDAATVALAASGGNGNYEFFLQPDLANPIANPFSIQPSATTTFDFVVTDGCGTPPATASSTITVYPTPTVDFTADEQQGCLPLTVSFTDQTTPAAAQWNWDFGDPDSGVNTSTMQNPGHSYLEAGTYTVSLSVVTANGCVGQTTESGFIEVYTPPLANFEPDTFRRSIIDPTFQFTDYSIGNISEWNWDFGDGSTSIDQHPTNTYLDTGLFIVTLNVVSAEGCESTTTERIFLSPILTLYVPNSFTPDKDNINDRFLAFGEGYDWSTYQMTIYNRWGEEIFVTDDIEQGWNGKYKDDPVEAGMYAWRIYVSDYYGRVYPFNGNVILLR
ncbi:MAG: PKD domain-containing protein [Flavobacteriales bacterium]|nr:PKD domain-containing protein [Flavobacteriales bacterium]